MYCFVQGMTQPTPNPNLIPHPDLNLSLPKKHDPERSFAAHLHFLVKCADHLKFRNIFRTFYLVCF